VTVDFRKVFTHPFRLFRTFLEAERGVSDKLLRNFDEEAKDKRLKAYAL